jgi:L-iditol 2-dehydrogenase
MKALLKAGRQVEVRTVPIPVPRDDEIRVRVALAGVCRTDVQVARGELPSANPIILGHEFAGQVDALGNSVCHVRVGERVAVLPVLPCHTCSICRQGDEINCPSRGLLGVERDGAFAGFVVVPGRNVFALPPGLSWQAAAYAEPVAAALSVLSADLPRQGQGLILGRNRFSLLVQRLLQAQGYERVVVCGPEETDSLPADRFDYVIETALEESTLERMVRVARPHAMLVLKSRRPGTIPLEVLPLLRKQLTIRAVNYGPFSKALALLSEGQLDLEGLFGEIYPLEEFADAFAQDSGSESAKLFLDPWGEHVRRDG